MSYEEVATSTETFRTDFKGLRLTPVYSSFEMEPLTLSTGRFTIGASPECDVQINMEGIAAKHCLLVVGSRRSIVQAYSPLTWINDGAVKEGTLRDGDRFIVGPIEFKVTTVDLVNQKSNEPKRADRSLWQHVNSVSAEDVPIAVSAPVTAFTTFAIEQKNERQAYVEDMLNDVQSMLDELFVEKRSTDAEFVTQQEKLARYEADVKQQHQEVEQRLQALHTLREEVRTSNVALENIRVQQLEAELASKQLLLDQQRLSVEEIQVEIQQQAAALEAERLSLGKERTELNQERRDFQQWEKSLIERENSIAETEKKAAVLIQQEQDVTDKLKSLTQLEEQVRAQQSQLEERFEEVSRSEGGIEVRRQELTELEQQLKVRVHELDARTAEVESRCGLLEPQRVDVEARQKQLKVLQQDLDARETELVARAAQVAERMQRIGATSTELDIREDALQQQLLELQGQQAAYSALQKSWEIERVGLETAFKAQSEALQAQLHEYQLQNAELSNKDIELEQKLTELAESNKAQRAAIELLTIERDQHQEACVILKQRQLELEQLQEQVRGDQAQEQSEALIQERAGLQVLEEQLQKREQELEARFVQVELSEAQLAEERRLLDIAQESLVTAPINPDLTEARSATLKVREAELDSRELDLEVRAQQLFKQKEELAAAQKVQLSLVDDESNKTEISREALSQQLYGVIEERNHLQELRGELESERDQLLKELREMSLNRDNYSSKTQEFEEKLQEAAEEREAYLLERQALITERQEFEDRVKEHSVNAVEWEEQSDWIREERVALLAEKDALEMERELLTTERNVLQQQALQLKKLRENSELSSETPPYESTYEGTQEVDEEQFFESREDLESPDHTQPRLLLERAEQDLLNRSDLLDSAELESRTAYRDQADPFDDEFEPDQQVAELGVEHEAEVSLIEQNEVDEIDDEATRLRLELAALFGLETDPLKAKKNASSEAEDYHDEITVEKYDDGMGQVELSSEFGLIESDVLNQESDSNQSDLEEGVTEEIETESLEGNGEDSVADYMERLLARTRRGAPAMQTSVKKKVIAPPEKVESESISAPLLEQVEKNIEKKRKLDSTEKEVMRANLDSFRELANQSARNAVAKSLASRAQSTLTLYLTGISIGWLLTLVLFTSELWTGNPQRTFGVISALISLALTVKTLLVYLDVQRNLSTSIATFEMVSEPTLNEAENEQF